MKIGDQVQWCQITNKKKHIILEQKEGEIIEITDDRATVKSKNGHRKTIAIKNLRLTTEQGHLTELVREAAKGIDKK